MDLFGIRGLYGLSRRDPDRVNACGCVTNFCSNKDALEAQCYLLKKELVSQVLCPEPRLCGMQAHGGYL